ncbi:MAG TPA: nitrate- and nitrite sensing domain-containing protein, partial [Acidimicrobiales bacterium]|nr:nitrate- and nitrite sensing domain-containing protein [Acidimicrobiales bacterium]
MGRAGKITLLAVATIVLAVGSGVLLVEVADRFDTASDDEAGAPFAAVFDPANAMLDALDDEASATSLDLMGAGDLVDGPVLTLPETRRATDEKIARLRTSLDHRDDDVVDHYQQAVDALQGLQTLRDEVDADTSPRELANATAAEQIVDRYREAGAPLDEALRTGILRIDDPALRDGLVLGDTSARQARIVSALVRDLVPRRGVHRPPRHRRRPPPHADVAALPPAPRLPPAPDLALTR